MLYKGTEKRSSKKIAEEIEKNGGELNGFTSEIVTSFWCKMPSNHLNVALEVLTDMIKNSKFDEKELEKERKVIFEEIKMRRDNPAVYVYDKIQKFLYGGTLGFDLIGTHETMNSISREKILKKYREIYTPNNLILTVVGDADFESIVDWAEKNFGKEKGSIPEQEIILKNDVCVEEREGLNQATLAFAFHSPLMDDEKVYAAEVLATLMGHGMSSRLFSEIREKRNLAYSVGSSLDSSKKYSYTIIHVGTSPENVELVKEIILKEFEDVSKNLTQKELNQIKEQLIGNYRISMEDSQAQSLHLLYSELSGDAKDFYEYEENISQVNLEDVKKLASEVKEGKYSFFALIPKK
jgi:predicted Zn-dependent peptidase